VNVVDVLCMPIWNRAMKPTVMVLSVCGREMVGLSLSKTHCNIYGNATMNPLLQLIYANKNVLKRYMQSNKQGQ
jgi:hypothetical protein